jgi:acyl-CoA thioester hydrolase
MPSLTEIERITPTIDTMVTEDLVDANGHMSLPRYVAAAARAVWTRQQLLGLDLALDRGISFFVTEQHAHYLGEMVLGDRFSVHPRFLARSNRALHTATFIVDATRRRLACSIESVSVCVSLDSRRSVSMSQELADSFDEAIRHDGTLPDSITRCSSLWR